jgi:hypothetical protein
MPMPTKDATFFLQYDWSKEKRRVGIGIKMKSEFFLLFTAIPSQIPKKGPYLQFMRTSHLFFLVFFPYPT